MAIVFYRKNSSNLLVVFNGWAADATMIPPHPQMDMCVLSQWQNMQEFPTNTWEQYEKVIVVGWSFGVVCASEFLEQTDLKNIVRTIAINGSPAFIDDTYGIREEIFEKTLASISAETIEKFMKRLWGSAKNYEENQQRQSHRTFQSMKEELLYFSKKEKRNFPSSLWDVAIISLKDWIFTPQNLRNYWQTTSAKVIEWEQVPHCPFLPSFSWNNLEI